MRLRLLRRRRNAGTPRLLVRRVLPWPLRWALVALVLGFCAAVALWAFEFGRSLAGLDGAARAELQRLRAEVGLLRGERSQVLSLANTSDSMRTAERAAQNHLGAQLRQLEAENRNLREDLGFFERLMPVDGAASVGTGSIAIRGLQADLVSSVQLRWQALVMQPVRNAPEFQGRLELTLAGLSGGRPWTLPLPGGPVALQMRQYRRLEGLVELPPNTVVQTVSAQVLDAAAAPRATHTVRLAVPAQPRPAAAPAPAPSPVANGATGAAAPPAAMNTTATPPAR